MCIFEKCVKNEEYLNYLESTQGPIVGEWFEAKILAKNMMRPACKHRPEEDLVLLVLVSIVKKEARIAGSTHELASNDTELNLLCVKASQATVSVYMVWCQILNLLWIYLCPHFDKVIFFKKIL